MLQCFFLIKINNVNISKNMLKKRTTVSFFGITVNSMQIYVFFLYVKIFIDDLYFYFVEF